MKQTVRRKTEHYFRSNRSTRVLLALCALAVGTAPFSGTACGITNQAIQSCECCQAGSCCVDGSKTDPVSTQPLTPNTSGGKITLNVAPVAAMFTVYPAFSPAIFSGSRVSLGHFAPDRAFLCTFLI
ncbi:MAG TPA: hypothetical protein VJ719_03820 [Chthoniobacterales bacterium]|nr:hypothetical protein [Chthoniobacterales bacterium]